MPLSAACPVQLYTFALPAAPDAAVLAAAWAVLSTDEQSRANGFRLAGARNNFILSRAQLRHCLSVHTGISSKDLNFCYSDHGKPSLAEQSLGFSLSHSKQWLAIAIGRDCELGVDIEPESPKRAWLAIAERYFHPDEFRQLKSLPAQEAQKRFFRLWTLKEALLKARGTGIATGLDKASFEFKADLIRVNLANSLKEQGHTWQVHQWHWSAGCYLALALHHPDPRQHPIEVHLHESLGTLTLMGQGSVRPA